MPDIWPDEWFPPGQEGFPLPDWNAIADHVEAEHPPENWHQIYCNLGTEWMERVRRLLGGSYTIRESRNLILLSSVTDAKAVEVLNFLEQTNDRIREVIQPLLPEVLYGKCPVMVFADEQDFYEYVSDHIPDDGVFGGIGGIYIDRGYGHFAMPSEDLASYESVMSHEMCHAFLHHLELPLWLDEAITQEVQHSVAGERPYELDRELVRRHQEFWTVPLLQDFWSGDSFHLPDEGQELSYHLSRFILHGLHRGGVTPREKMNEFILRAKYDDAGQSAALEVLGVSLGECLVPLLGEGDWEPLEPAADSGVPGA